MGIPERERQIMADWYACMWVDVRDYELKAETRRGVVLGNPMVDLLFNAVMVLVHEEIHKGSGEMSGGMVPFAAGQNIWDVPRVVGCDDIAPASDETYVDDLCLMVSAEKPNELIERTAEMTRVCRRALAKHECILRPFGHGSQDLVACLQRVDGQRVITVDGTVVRMVRSYKHLGTIHTATGNLTEDATARVRAMMAFFSHACGTRLRLSETVTEDQAAAGGHVVVVHSSLCHGDMERVHAHSAEVLEHGLHAGVAEMCGAMPRCKKTRRRTSAWSCKCLGYRHCCAVSDGDMWRALPERGHRSSVLF